MNMHSSCQQIMDLFTVQYIMGDLMTLGSGLPISMLITTFAGLGSPRPKGVDLICNKARFTSAIESAYIFSLSS